MHSLHEHTVAPTASHARPATCSPPALDHNPDMPLDTAQVFEPLSLECNKSRDVPIRDCLADDVDESCFEMFVSPTSLTP